MAQLTPSTPTIVAPKGLGPGFWTATLVMTVINIALGIAICYLPLDFLLPAESNPVSNNAASVDFLFKFMTVFGVAIAVYVNGYVLYFAVAFRARRDDPPNAIGVPIHHASKLEIWWTVLPTLLLIVLMYLSIVVWKQIQFPQGATNLTMEAVGHQFNWEFRYPGLSVGLYSPKYEMHLPVGKQVKILVSSADVLHQFWVPEFRQKISAIPGMVTDLNMTPTVPGTYDISCSEYCGANHSTMQAKLIVEDQASFDKWLAARRAEAAKAPATLDLASGNAAAGQATFNQKCSACHNVAPFDQKKVGPGLAKLTDDPAHPKLVDGDDPTPASIAAILNKGYTGPIGVMPNKAANGLSDKDVADLVAYLVSQK